MSRRDLGGRLVRAEQAARRSLSRCGPEVFIVHARVAADGQALCRFCLDDERHVMAEAEARAFLGGEFARRGWDPVRITVRHILD